VSDEQRNAQIYLMPPKDTFWEWRDEGEVITWTDGRTIAFRAELLQVLRCLAPQGLPPISAILILLAAMRENWNDTLGESGILAGCLRTSNEAWQNVDALVDTLEGLEKVHQLPTELRSPLVAKVILANFVFEHLKAKTSPREASEVVRFLDEGVGEEIITPFVSSRWQRNGPAELFRDLECMQAGLRQISVERLNLRRETGLDDLPQPAELELPAAERIRSLLKELDDDRELSGLARLAQQLMAAVTLPRAVADRDELQVGGVSDITNRGPLDRLLLSELAHDDTTLMVRVALNEAMYLRRESPPRTPPRQRAIFLETGIRSWGVPRIYATAVALALAATTEQNTEVVAFRAKGSKVEPVDLKTRSGLVEHLAILEPQLHPGEALEAFEQAMAKVENVAEPVLITTDDVLDDDTFQLALSQQAILPLHVATVNRDGEFRLVERTLRGSKLFREATLNLDELFDEPTKSASPLIDREGVEALPAIFSVEPFPLLLPHNIDSHRTWRADPYGVISVTTDQRLMLWKGKGHGALQLAEGIPRGQLLWSSARRPGGTATAVVGQYQGDNMCLLDINLVHECCTQTQLEVGQEHYRCVCSHNGALFAIGKQSIDILGPTEGDLLQTLKLPTGMSWERDRFFRGPPGDQWYALSFDGRTACFEAVLDEKAKRCPQLLTLFEREGTDGPIGVTTKGDLYFTATGALKQIRAQHLGQPKSEAVSTDGSRIVLSQPGEFSAARRCFVVDVDTLTITDDSYGDPQRLAEPFHDIVTEHSLRNRFLYIALDRRGVITLTSKKNQQLAIDYDSATSHIRLRPNKVGPNGTVAQRAFDEIETPNGLGYRLSVATWDDGSQAFLDSRGLLHLKSSDQDNVPESTIVLNDGVLSGWCSDGQIWGLPYFIGEKQSAPKREVFWSAIRAFAKRLA